MKNWIVFIAALALVAAGCRKEEKKVEKNGEKPQQQTASGTGVESFQSSTSTATAAPEPQTPATAESTDVGSQMPAYEAKTLDGAQFDLAKERGNVVFLNLWATWCGPCRYEIPELDRLNKQYGPRGFKVVGVSLDEGGPEGVQEFIKQNQMSYPVVLDPDQKLANLFQTSVIPTSAVIDRKGKIVWKKFGAIDPHDEELVKAIESAL